MNTERAASGLHLDQAPPLSIPFRFFLSAPVFLFASGLLLLWAGERIVLSRYLLPTIAFTHLCTLGVLCMVMFGALYQMAPVVAASAVPRIKLAYVVHGALVLGVCMLAAGLLAEARFVLLAAFAALGIAWLGFVLPVGVALLRSPATSDVTVQGMRLSVACLFVVGFLGVWMAHGHSGGSFPGPRPLFMGVHLGLAILGWTGGLITAVSYQVLPMFYLSPALSNAHQRGLLLATFGSCGLSLAGLMVCSILPADTAQPLAPFLPLLLLPAALSVWVAFPLWTLRALSQRKRKRADPSLRFWRTGLLLSPLLFALGVASVACNDPRIELLFAWLALFGWALLIVHGMLYRIVPFLVWFHRLSPLVGHVPVPSVGKLLSERRSSVAFALHASMLASGALAIALGSASVARLTGLLLAVLALHLLYTLVALARYRPPAV